MAYIYYTVSLSGDLTKGVNVNLGAVEYQQFSDGRIMMFRFELTVNANKNLYKEVSATTAVKILKLIGAKY